MKLQPIPIFSEDGGVGFDELMIVNKLNELVEAYNLLSETESFRKIIGKMAEKENLARNTKTSSEILATAIPASKPCPDCIEEKAHHHKTPEERWNEVKEQPQQIDVEVEKLCDEYAQCYVHCSLLSEPLDEQQKTYRRMQEIITTLKNAINCQECEKRKGDLLRMVQV